MTGNIASLAMASNFTAGAFAEQKFMLPQLSFFLAGFGLATSSGNFAFHAGHSGSQQIGENIISLAYARRLGDKMDIGTQFHYRHHAAKGYGSFSSVSASLAGRFHLNEDLLIGFQLGHPAAYASNGNEGKPPGTFSLGSGWQISGELFTGIEMYKAEGRPPEARASFSYQPYPNIVLQVGMTSGPAFLETAISLGLKYIRLHLTASFHPQLGMTPGVGIVYTLKQTP